MKRSNLKTNRLILFLPYVLFFGLSAFYFYWFVNYLFFYQEKSSLFLLSFSYLAEHLSQPGGFLKYLGELQSAFYYYPMAGAAVVSFEICLVIFLIAMIGKEITGRLVFFVPFAAGAALFYLQTHYQFSSFNTIGILLQLLFFYLTIRFMKGKREWFAVAFFPGWYLLTGSFSLVYLSLFLFHSVFQKARKAWLKPLVILDAGAFFFLFAAKYRDAVKSFCAGCCGHFVVAGHFYNSTPGEQQLRILVSFFTVFDHHFYGFTGSPTN